MTMTGLTALPVEILHAIFSLLDPKDLAALPRVCSSIRDNVAGNAKLFKDVYMNHYDKPTDLHLDWIQEVKDITKLSIICERKTYNEKADHIDFAYDVVTRMLKNASSKGYTTDNSVSHAASYNADLLKDMFKDDTTQQAFMQRSFLFERLRQSAALKFPIAPNPVHQQSAKLHCLYGQPILNVGRLRSSTTYPFACSKVYDLRGYTANSLWGPFNKDGSGNVDWELLEAIMVTIGYNIHSKKFVKKLFSDEWDSPFSGSWPRSFHGSPAKDISSLDARDPYGVTGTYYRVICFLDFNDFLAFNFSRGLAVPDDTPRLPIRVGEATRLIVMQIHVIAIEEPGEDDGAELPVVHFEGVSKMADEAFEGGHSMVREMKGSVRLTKEGEVHWTTTSIFHGHARWRSEGVQIGGVQSGRGVFGSWGDNERGELEPVGPSAFWKTSNDEQTSSTLSDILPNGFMAYSALLEMDPDPEGDMDYITADDDGDDDDEPLDFETIEGELPALLLDAELGLLGVPIEDDDEADGNGDDDADGTAS